MSLLALAGALVLGGCNWNGSSASTAAAKAHSARSHTSARSPNTDAALADMVAAVSGSKPGPPVEMKFLLSARPEVGQVVDVDVAVVPLAPVPENLSVSFQAIEGLEIVEGSTLERTDKLVDQTPVRHTVRILPKRDGIFALTATVSFTTSNQDLTRTFSIPVVAGEGMPAQVAKGR